jgi:hypothetical protein
VQAGTTQRRSPSNANRSQGSQLAGLIQPQLAAMAPGKTKPPEPEPESYPLPSEAPINTTYDVAVQSCKGDRFPLVRITLPLLTLAHPVRADWGLGRCRYARQSTFIRRTQARHPGVTSRVPELTPCNRAGPHVTLILSQLLLQRLCFA